MLSPRPAGADAVHAVVPVAAADERQAVGAGGEALVDRPHAVFEERAVLGGHARLAVRLRARPARAAAPRGTARARPARRRRRSCGRTPPRRRAATADRPSSASAGRGRSARATSAGRRLRRTAGRRPGADAPSRARAAPAATPSRPAADRESRRRRPAGSSRRASRDGSSRPDRGATD